MLCKFCNKELNSKQSHHQHEIRCKENINRIIPYSTSSHWTDERKKAWSKQCLETKCNNKVPWSDEKRIKYGKRSKIINEKYWTNARRLEQSERMKKIVSENPYSYSKNNVSGRVKIYETNSTNGITKVKGKWELIVAQYLNNNNIRWTNDIEPYKYFWNTGWHLYFPDFYLLDKNILIEVKGYQVERDLCKWNSVKDKKLVILKKKEIKEIIQGSVGMAYSLINS
jgi:hypothetical protein